MSYINNSPSILLMQIRRCVSPGKSSGAHVLIVHLGEDVRDGGALEVCPLNHFAGSGFVAGCNYAGFGVGCNF